MQSRVFFEPSLITLGTAQFGTAYGVGNTVGKTTEAEALQILDRALELGINTIDTAPAYGIAEQLIGRWLASRKPAGIRVVTKVSRVPTGSDADRRHFIRTQIANSKAALGIAPLPLVLLHEETDLLSAAVVDEFQLAIAKGSIENFGASVYSVAVAEKLIASVPIAALQVPANIADRRFELAGIFSAASARGIAVFVRSVFLQGLLLMRPERLPRHLKAFAPLLTAINDAAAQSGRPAPDLLISALRDISGITSLVVGVDNANQLDPHLRALSAPPLSPDIPRALIRLASSIEPEILIPTNWKRFAGRD